MGIDNRPCYQPAPERASVAWWIVGAVALVLCLAPGVALIVWG